MPLTHAHTLRGKPPPSTAATIPDASGDVMNALFRSTGRTPAAYSTSTGTLDVIPIRSPFLIVVLRSMLIPHAPKPRSPAA